MIGMLKPHNNEVHAEWLNMLCHHVELETMTVLFAKSVMDYSGSTHVLIGQRPNEISLRSRRDFLMSRQQSRCIARLIPSEKSSWMNPRQRNLNDDSSAQKVPKCNGNFNQAHFQPMKVSLPSSSSNLPPQMMPKILRTPETHNIEALYPVRLRNGSHGRERRRTAALRHSITVNDDVESRVETVTDSKHHRSSSLYRDTHSSSSTASKGSFDSGQCSGHSGVIDNIDIISSDHGLSHISLRKDSEYVSLQKPGNILDSMDHILRVASTVLTLLDANVEDVKLTREFLHKIVIYIQVTQQSPCGQFLNEEDFREVQILIESLLRNGCPQKISEIPEKLTRKIRSLITHSMLIFMQVIAVYLNECNNQDRLLVIALDHLVHLLLFGDEICIETVKHHVIERMLEFAKDEETPAETLRLLLRALSVLCGVNKGCAKLVSVVINLLCQGVTSCATEAAGVLTQLTSSRQPSLRSSCFAAQVVPRLLHLISDSEAAESILLCAAALANLSVNPKVAELLYEHNAIIRLVDTCSRPTCGNEFVFEQIVMIFSRLSDHGYMQALVAQKAIPFLFKILENDIICRADYRNRIRYKAVVCLGTIAKTGIGLKSIYETKGHQKISELMRRESVLNRADSPLNILCQGIKNRLESTYYARNIAERP